MAVTALAGTAAGDMGPRMLLVVHSRSKILLLGTSSRARARAEPGADKAISTSRYLNCPAAAQPSTRSQPDTNVWASELVSAPSRRGQMCVYTWSSKQRSRLKKEKRPRCRSRQGGTDSIQYSTYYRNRSRREQSQEMENGTTGGAGRQYDFGAACWSESGNGVV